MTQTARKSGSRLGDACPSSGAPGGAVLMDRRGSPSVEILRTKKKNLGIIN